ncbi:MAG: TCP-1/cpn60 chaperonin family protein, partial [Bacilli bacterium]
QERLFKLSDIVIAHEGAENEVISGVLLNKERMNKQMPEQFTDVRVLVIQDALEPEDIDDEALGTEIGFSKYLEYKAEFQGNLTKLKQLGINMIVVDRGVDSSAEEFCIDHNIMVVQRVSSKDIRKVMDHTGARGVKRTALRKPIEDLESYVGFCESVEEDERLEKIRMIGGKGKPMATILVGASTGEVVGERERIAKDAASAVQAAVKGGYLPGGGSVEISIAREVERFRETIRGMEGFGVQAVANTLRKPLSQIVANAGFNPLEKVEEVKAAQIESNRDSYGIDCDTGKVLDLEEIGVIDPAPVKIHALKAAGEVCEAILKIHTIIRMKPREKEEEEWD